MRDHTWILQVTAVIALFALVVGMNYSCAPGAGKALDVLRINGFRDGKVTDSHYASVVLAGCSSGDSVAHDATATNANGERVKVIVCCGVWKGCTVRVP